MAVNLYELLQVSWDAPEAQIRGVIELAELTQP